MAHNQKWTIPIDGEIYYLEYTYKGLFGKPSLKINGEDIDLSRKSFQGKKREILLGDKKCIFAVMKNHTADIVIDGKFIGSGVTYEE